MRDPKFQTLVKLHKITSSYWNLPTFAPETCNVARLKTGLLTANARREAQLNPSGVGSPASGFRHVAPTLSTRLSYGSISLPGSS